MSYGLDYGTYVDDYLYNQYQRYGNYGYNSNGSNQQDTSIFQTTGNKNTQYTCTDGANDGKIGISAVYHLGKGVVNGVVNGVKGMFTDSTGKFSLSKTLLTVGMGALCVAFPVVGAVACGIGAVSGGMQLVNGIKNVAAAKENMSDAQAKEAWENIGEGASTVVGCVAGAKASIGAMKSASTAAKLSSVDDIGKFLGNPSDIKAALGNTDDMVKALKAHGINNTDEVLKALDGIDNIDDAMKAIQASGKTSALGAVDDTLTGAKKITETAKALGKDAISSSKNNMGKAWNKVTSTLDDASDYRKAKSEYNKAKVANDEATEEFLKAQEQLDQDIVDAARTKVGKTSDELAAAKAKMDATQTGQKVNARAKVQSDIDIQRKNVQAKQAKLDKAIKAAKESDDVKGIKKYSERKAKIDEIVKSQQGELDRAQKALDAARAKTTFGQFKANVTKPITSSNTYQQLTSQQKGSVLKMLKDRTYDWNGLKEALGKDYTNVVNFLQADIGEYSQAAKEFGWDKVNQVLYMAYALNQTTMTV